MRRNPSIVAALLVFLTVACGQPIRDVASTPTHERSGGSPERISESEQRPDDFPDGPPPVTIRYGDETAELEAWSYCYGNGCVDGAPPADLVDVGSAEEVMVDFPLADWTFGATFQESGKRCARYIDGELEEIAENRWVLEPHGHRDTYDVTLFGRGDGDLSVTFRWATPEEGPLPEPRARTAILADHDGEVDSYGVELMLSNLATTPKEAKATITVEASGGESLTFDAKRAKGDCWSEGTVYWDRPDESGLAAARLGEPPFTYRVVVRIDGDRYVAEARWPEDVIRGNEPSVRLDFEPPLPALE